MSASDICVNDHGMSIIQFVRFSIVLWQLKEMKQPYRGWQRMSALFSFCPWSLKCINIGESDPATVCANVRAGVRPQMSSDDCPPQFRDLIAQCWRQCPQKRPAFDGIVNHGCSVKFRCKIVCQSRYHHDTANNSSVSHSRRQ